MTHPCLHPQRADHVKDEVFGEHTGTELVVKPETPHLELVHRQALTGEHIAHLAGTDAEGNRTKGAMGRRVGVTAGHGHPRLGQPKLRGNHMNDALTAAA